MLYYDVPCVFKHTYDKVLADQLLLLYMCTAVWHLEYKLCACMQSFMKIADLVQIYTRILVELCDNLS
jgi:hypothetical protein